MVGELLLSKLKAQFLTVADHLAEIVKSFLILNLITE